MSTTAALTKDLRFRSPTGLSGLLENICRARVLSALGAIQVGRVTLSDCQGTYEFGALTEHCDLHARVFVFDPRTYAQVGLRGDLGAGESYMDGRWSCDDLTALGRIFLRNEAAMQAVEGVPGKLLNAFRRFADRPGRNTLRGSRRNVSRHYDLGNDFYRLWLDDTLTYSCAVFAEGDDLRRAQTRKYDEIAQALNLSDEDSVLEIGCGWGGFALYVAEHYGCHVTATTISSEQFRVARRRVRDAGLGDRIEIVLEDYRQLRGQFDKIVSIEMFEAVGHEYQDTFFDVCAARLRPGGRMLMQTITIAEDRYEAALSQTDFIQRHVFPGGALPSKRSLAKSVARAGGLSLSRFREIGAHYATTLWEWRRRFNAVRSEVSRLGYDDRFIRMWEFYLSYCEAGFRESSIGTVHALIERTERPE